MDKEKLFSWEANPYLGDFVREFGKPYDPENDDYNPTLFTEDIKSGKNDPIYNVHMYWTKVPPEGIAKLINHFTSPGDLVLDPFCGSGMTGVACLMTGRHAILIDLCPAATFIAKNYTTPINPEEFKMAVREIEEKVREEMDWLYETRCRRCGDKAIINYTIWSDVYECPICEKEMLFWDVAVRDGEVLREWQCPHCSADLNKQRAKLVGTEPVRVNYNCPRCGRREDKVNEFDLKKLEEIEEREIPYWYPRNEFPKGYNTRQPMIRGIRRVDQFFTRRNLWALARLWEEAGKKGGTFFLPITAIMFETSLQKRYFSRRPLRGTLYIPAVIEEDNVYLSFLRKSLTITRGLNYMKKGGKIIISTQSATDLSRIPDSSIDYCFTDPPYGANINYSELNFVWEAWLGHFTKIDEEAVINPYQRKGLDEYRELMEKSFKEIFRVLKPGRFLSLTFHNSQSAVWEAIQSALANAGFGLAYIGVFDKEQRTFKQVTTEGAVGYDLLVHAYKPKLSNHIRIERKIELEDVVKWLEERLRNLHPSKNEERTARRLHSTFIGWCLSQNVNLGNLEKIKLRDFNDFFKLLDTFFNEIDGYYFLPGQLPIEEGTPTFPEAGFASIKDGKPESAINLLRNFLQEPKSFSDIHPEFIRALGSIKCERTLEDLLDENFINEGGKWRTAINEEEEKKIERERNEKQLSKFESWWRAFEGGKERNLPPEEIMVNGLRQWFKAGKLWKMVGVMEMLKKRGLWYDTPYKARTLLEIAEGEVRGENA